MFMEHPTITSVVGGALAMVPPALLWAAGPLGAALMDVTIGEMATIAGSGGAVALATLLLMVIREIKATLLTFHEWKPTVRIEVVPPPEKDSPKK
jgi:hypothetical protein